MGGNEIDKVKGWVKYIYTVVEKNWTKCPIHVISDKSELIHEE